MYTKLTKQRILYQLKKKATDIGRLFGNHSFGFAAFTVPQKKSIQ